MSSNKRKLEEVEVISSSPSTSKASSSTTASSTTTPSDSHKTLKSDTSSTPGSSTTPAVSSKKPVVVSTISSAPIKYTTANTPKSQYNLYDHVLHTTPLASSVSYPSYQDALKSTEPTKTNPQYVFPHNAPKKADNLGNVNPRFFRKAASDSWEDTSLADWDPTDHRLFVGDLGNEVNDDMLMKVFNKYPTFQRAKVIRDKKSTKSKGYGFVSFREPADLVQAIKDMNGKYIGNRPCKLKKSRWKDRLDEEKIEKDSKWQANRKPGQRPIHQSPSSISSIGYPPSAPGDYGAYNYDPNSYGQQYNQNQYY